jgi:hypothetical protein
MDNSEIRTDNNSKRLKSNQKYWKWYENINMSQMSSKTNKFDL